MASLANINKVLETLFGPLDPAAEFRYYLEVDGLIGGAFAECTGMRAEREVLTYKEGGVNHYAHKLPGRTTYADITLRNGIMFNVELWDWFAKGMEDCDVKHRDITITHYSSYFNVPARWYHVKDAFPVSWEGSTLNSSSSQLAMESLTLTFKTLEVEGWSLLDFAAKMLIG